MQGLLVEVGVEQEVLVQVVADVQVQVLQLVVTIGLPAVVFLWTSQCSIVVVALGHSLPTSQVTVGQWGTSAPGCTPRTRLKVFAPGSAMPIIH